MKKLKVGINGFGRIGRAIFRINELQNIFDIVVINDINPDNKNIAYLIEYDTTYGRFNSSVEADDESIFYADKKIYVYHENNILNVPWDNHDIDIVVESSGVFNNLQSIKSYNKTNVKNFIVTYAVENVKTIILGVNEDDLNPTNDKILSSSICDTISLTPILKLIQQDYEILGGFLTTLHPYLGYQNLLDGPSASWSQPGDVFSHYSLGRASINNLIPKSTSAVSAANLVMPGLTDKIQSFSYRVPTSIVSSAVLILQLDNNIDAIKLKDGFYRFELNQTYNILKNSTKPLVSLDYAKEDYSVIIDHRWTKIENGSLLKIVYWYDNEWGYSSRVVDIIKILNTWYNK